MNEIYDMVVPHLEKVGRGGGPNIKACCPFHDDNTPSFSINIENGLWQCFGCGKTGNLLNFFQYLNVPRPKIDALITPLRKTIERNQTRSKEKWSRRFNRRTFEVDEDGVEALNSGDDPFWVTPILPESILGAYDFTPTRLVDAGFDPDLLERIGIGFDRVGRRITFPLRDLYGNLAGISGRAVLEGDEPRYKVYEGGTRNTVGDFGPTFDEMYPRYHLNSKRLLWNADRAWSRIRSQSMSERDTPIFILEGYKAGMWVEQLTGKIVVVTMGTSMSSHQLDVLAHITDGPVVLMYDNDIAGWIGTKKVGEKLRRHLDRVYVAILPDGKKQPDNCSQEELQESMENNQRFELWLMTDWRQWSAKNGALAAKGTAHHQ